jgi:carbon monoxide dehydrogenase subunit G
MNRFAALLWLAFSPGMTWAAAPDAGGNATARIEIEDDVVRIEAEASIPASIREVWEVLTDFENLPRYLSSVSSSKVLARNGNVVRLSQTGKVNFGPFSFEFQSIRELTLTPFEKFESQMIEGNMKRFRSSTRLESGAGVTRIRYQSEGVPDTFLPLSLLRSSIETGAREHYQEISREVLRRKAVASGK